MRSHVALALSAATLAVVVSGCGAVQEVAQTADTIADTATTVQVCTDALAQAGRLFDASSPERAVDSAHSAAASLTDLAASAADTSVNQAITALAATLGGVTVEDLVGRPAAWRATKADQVAALTNACAP